MFMLSKIKFLILEAAVIFLLISCTSSMQPVPKKSELLALRSATVSPPVEPNTLVLMLPLKGEFAANSQAIRNGFLVAYDYFRNHHPEINVKVVDTSGGNLSEIYHQAVTDGAEIIVGPLTKKEVEELLKIAPLPIPTIALNTLDNYPHNFAPNLYQFGLLPQDEAIQIAVRMMQQQHDQVAIIVSQNSWSNKILAAFKNRYEAAGGQVVATLNYDSKLRLADQLCPFLAKDAAKLCVVQKRKDKQFHDPHELMRRQDINAIFLIATPSEARQIVPLLKFYYAGDLPIYATSSVYTGVPQPSLDLDLDGIYFCDLPWILKAPGFFNDALQSMQQKITTLWGDSSAKYGRLYALGIDAYNLSLGLNGLINAPQIGFEGASGTLYLDDFNHIYRDLKWAKMQNGVPVVLP